MGDMKTPSNIIATIALLATVVVNGLTVTRSSLFGYTVRGKVLDAAEVSALVDLAKPSLGSEVAVALAPHRATGRLTVSKDLRAPYERIVVECAPHLGSTMGDVEAYGRRVSATLRAAGLEACQVRVGQVIAWRA